MTSWYNMYSNNDRFSKHQTHYEQWGVLCGRVAVEGHEEQELYLKSLRDHSFGEFDISRLAWK